MTIELACGGDEHGSCVRIVDDAPAEVAAAFQARRPEGPIAIIADQAVVGIASRIARAVQATGLDARFCSMQASEGEKSLATVDTLTAQLLSHGVTRSGAVVAVGGGIVGDTAGFVAATYMRGVRCVQVPTTLLAMVDASIGGKTAVNVRLRDGTLAKNASGAFALPELVVCAAEALDTLPAREMHCGLAECVKHGLLADEGLLPWLRANAMAVVGKDHTSIATLVARAAAVKVAIVDRDPTERGERALLNLGHTYAHAIEARHAESVKHGEAVSLGLVAAMAVAARLGRVDPAHIDELRGLLTALGLPCSLRELVERPDPAAALRRCMELDKKRASSALVLVLPQGRCGASIVSAPSEDAVMHGWSAIGAPGLAH